MLPRKHKIDIRPNLGSIGPSFLLACDKSKVISQAHGLCPYCLPSAFVFLETNELKQIQESLFPP